MADAPKVLLDIPFDQWGRALGLTESDAYRVRQLQEWIFPKRARAFSEMTNIPAELRERWEKTFRIHSLTLERQDASTRDGTARLFFRTIDGKPVSAVFLPSRDGERVSLCLSTQVGCAWGCVFCASGRVQYERNLTVSEILGQIFGAEKAFGKSIDSLLFMGMGEPLANFENLRLALEIIRSPLGLGYGARHVTVSTSGLVPMINRLGAEAPRVNLAVSLHAADDETRRRILPKSSTWPIKDLLRASWDFQKLSGAGSRVTFEYILLAGINDSLRAAQRLSNLLRGKMAWVNLIVYNPVPGLPFKQPSEETVKTFAAVLEERGLFVRVRKPQGTDIDAGCGQLGSPVRVNKDRFSAGEPPETPDAAILLGPAEGVVEAPEIVPPPVVVAPPPAVIPPPVSKPWAAKPGPRAEGQGWKPKPGRPDRKPWSGDKPGGKPFAPRDGGPGRGGWKDRPKTDGAEGKPWFKSGPKPKPWAKGPGAGNSFGKPRGDGPGGWKPRPAEGGPGGKPWVKKEWKPGKWPSKPAGGGNNFGKPRGDGPSGWKPRSAAGGPGGKPWVKKEWKPGKWSPKPAGGGNNFGKPRADGPGGWKPRSPEGGAGGQSWPKKDGPPKKWSPKPGGFGKSRGGQGGKPRGPWKPKGGPKNWKPRP